MTHCSLLGIVDVFYGQVYTKTISGDLELLRGEAEFLTAFLD
jgi:hypothetical protein